MKNRMIYKMRSYNLLVKYDSIFDVVGHIMVGPSSSHTAGACRIGYIAQLLFGTKPKKCKIFLHGSFAATYKGHGTDKALLAGILGFMPNDERIRNAIEIAEEEGLEYKIDSIDLGSDAHPNSVLLNLFHDNDERMTIVGSSIGGGNIVIDKIDGFEAGFNGDNPTIITFHQDVPGIISQITRIISNHDINISTMRLSKNRRKQNALCWLEVNKNIPETIKEELLSISLITGVRILNV